MSQARAAEMKGDEAALGARLFAAMAAADPADRTIARRGDRHRHPVGAGRAGGFAGQVIPADELPVDARLMLAADSLRARQDQAGGNRSGEGRHLDRGRTVRPARSKAWEQTARGKGERRPQRCPRCAAGSPLAPIADEQRAAMLFALAQGGRGAAAGAEGVAGRAAGAIRD